MKRGITCLMVLLLTLPVIGQQINEGQRKFEKHNLIDAFKKHRTDRKNNHYQGIAKLNEIIKNKRTAEKKELDSLISEQWDENLNEWVKVSKEQFTYDINENVNSYITSSWNTNNLDWDPVLKFEFTFDSNRNLIVMLDYWWNSLDSQWWNNNKIEFTYDIDNNLTLQTTYSWDIMSTQWYQSFKIEYTYDDNQNMILETYFEWLSGMWNNSYKDELTYDINNNLIQKLYYEWNWSASQWYSASKKWDYGYDGSNNLILEIYSDWDGNQWVNNDRYDYAYSAEGNLISDIGSDWALPNGSWVYVYKDTYAYDANQNRTLGNYYEWLSGVNDWSVYYKDEFIFDLAYSINDIIGPVLFEDILGIGFGDIVVAFNNMVIGYRGYEHENPIWVDTDKVIFYYSNYSNPLHINDAIVSKYIHLYPNPVDDVFTINSEIPLTKVEIYSLLGKKETEVTTDFEAIQVNNLSNGVYVVRIVSDKGITFRKLIKK